MSGTTTGGTAGSTSGTGGSASGAGGAGAGGTGAGGAGAGGAGAGGAGAGGAGAGGAGAGGGGGKGGAGGAGAGGGGAGGKGGAGGGGGGKAGAGGGGGGMCTAPVTITQTDMTHMHSLTIMASEINAGMPMMFTTGSGGMPAHTHTVMLTAQDFMTLRMGMPVMKTSSSTGHSHMYTIDCA
jgi:hypothetical protein